MSRYLDASVRLHQYLVDQHWDGQALVGPDPVGKINWRITRFVKSYSRWLPWKDNLAYMQGQGYWIRGNRSLFDLTGDSGYLELVARTARGIVDRQLSSGAWEHPPIRGRKRFVSAVESIWACLGLVSAYRRLGNVSYLDAALKGYEAIFSIIGLQRFRNSMGVNYYAHTKHLVPNVTTMLLWLMAEMLELTGDEKLARHSEKLIRFLEYAQLDHAEFEYVYGLRPHFQCYQYNSFQFLDLCACYVLTRNERLHGMLTGLAQFLSAGVSERGSCRYDCRRENPETNYWTAAIAAALRQAYKLGLGQYERLSEHAYDRLLSRQNQDGGFFFSDRNYGFLTDRQSYPRQQAMILDFLLQRADTQQ
ncbi:MAG: hypothetical protein ACOC6F_00140 [bacterium]